VDIENKGDAYGHVGVTAEIKIQLHGVGQTGQPSFNECQRALNGESAVGNKSKGIGDDRFFTKNDGKNEQSPAQIGPIKVSCLFRLQLGNYFSVICDRTRNDVRKESDIKAIAQKVVMELSRTAYPSARQSA